MSRRIIIKLGTSTLTAGGTRLSKRALLGIAQQVVTLREGGDEVVIVSSGAMAAGRARLGVTPASRPRKTAQLLPYKQMLAAVGQTHLMLAWEQAFDVFDTQVAQVLLTRDDLADRARYLNARRTLSAILQHRIVPIVNENDAITTEEIRIGDNDNLSALVATAINADLLIILSDIDGLFTADPRKDPKATLVQRVDHIDDTLRATAGDSKSGLGTGGMLTKLQAAELAMRSGTSTVLANGSRPHVLVDVAAGQSIGTRFVPASDPLEGRKRWLLGEKPSGSVTIDLGALRALRAGRSLLAVGVREVSGDFRPGDVISVRTSGEARELARGVVRYNSAEARRIAGKRSADVTQHLGDGADATLLHADELIVL